MKKMFALFCCAAALCLCAACGQDQQEEVTYKHTIYCGLNDAATGEQILSVEQAQEAARAIIIAQGCGYTEYVTNGGYLVGDTLFTNDTLVYEFFFADVATVNTIAAQIREELNLSSILMTEEPSAYQFLE